MITVAIFFLFEYLNILFYLKKQKQLRNSSLDEIDTMEGVQFERYLFELFKALGYKVKRTPAAYDFGADLILNDGNNSIVVQAKRYKNNVGIQAVQEALGAKAYYNSDQAWVITNSGFTKQAIELANNSDVKLYNRHDLSALIASAGKEKPSEKQIKRSFIADDKKREKCPLCESPMVLRNGKHGVFYGCGNFPKCKGIKKSK